MRLLVREEDMETGESCLDRETGEELTVTSQQSYSRQRLPETLPSQPTDAETGEPETVPFVKKKPFQIPRGVLKTKDEREIKYKNHRKITTKSLLSKPPHMNCLKHKVECSTNMSPILFMLPTVFLFPAWATVLLLVFELICHAYVHKKNKLLPRTSKLVYKSPLHLLTSAFCAYCQSDKLMVKIGKMQDERLLKAHRKELAYCSYVERVSVVS